LFIFGREPAPQIVERIRQWAAQDAADLEEELRSRAQAFRQDVPLSFGSFTSFRAGTSYLNLIAQPAERRRVGPPLVQDRFSWMPPIK
jgi:hypothetical protein